jgi:cellulose synthase/poly-beta-1,6-N-acetylglucosamine synthase-like glycosyltransferase
MDFSVVIPAYREKNLNNLINRLSNQNLPKEMVLKKIVVVACGYEDLSLIKNKKVKIIREKIRKRKASAINSALNEITSEIVVLGSGDAMPKKDTVKNLLEPFSNSYVGMTAGRPIPLNDRRKFMGFLNHLVWLLHHLVSLEKPKVGEVFAFRKVIERIPRKLAADESYFEFIISKNVIKLFMFQMR